MFVSCSARTRFIPEPWLASSSFLNEVEDADNNENNNNSDNGLVERTIPWTMKAKKAYHIGSHFGSEQRRKKYLGEPSNYQGGHSLQGLWAMPGRR